MLKFKLLVLILIVSAASCCRWDRWGSCSQKCGGGYNSRAKRCGIFAFGWTWIVGRQSRQCNEFCYNRGSFYSGVCHCMPWRSGRCCQDCRHIYIPHCKPGKQVCGGTPDNIRCTECEKYYISGGYGNGCKTCEQAYYIFRGETKCYCMRGFTLSSNGYSCYDLNECALGTHNCHHKCTNTYGSFKCSCRPGYKLFSDGRTCVDIDECRLEVTGCAQRCINLLGSYKCACSHGYTLSGNHCCEDINECNENNGGCTQICVNEKGSFHCDCQEGFRLDSDQISCIDINECLGAKCENGGTCLNIVGSFTCECVKGFTGRHCEYDVNECEGFLKGACEDECVNTVGSFRCECSDKSTLNSDGMSCAGGKDSSSVFARHGITRNLLPRGCFTILLTRCTDDTSVDIFLSSTSPWFKLKTNISIIYTFGIAFVEVDKLSIPVSLAGLNIIKTSTSFIIVSDPLKLKEIDGFTFGDERKFNCYNVTTTPSDIRDFLVSSSFIKSMFQSIEEILPDWLRFSHLGSEVFHLYDLHTELLQGKEIQTGRCRGAPLHENRLYSVLKFGSRFSISFFGDERVTPAASRSEQFCLIVDICQYHGSSLFLIIPEESSGILNKFEIIDSIRRKYGIEVRPYGIGLSLNNDIPVPNGGKSLELWNGDGNFTFQVLHEVNLWLDVETVIASDGDNFTFELKTRSDIFTSVPNMKNIIRSIFLEEWDFYINAKHLGYLDIKFKVFGAMYTIKLHDIAVGDKETFASLGGLNQRELCGMKSNVPGLFMSLTVNGNLFQNIPILKNGLFGVNTKVFTYIATDPTPTSTKGNDIEIIQDIVHLKEMAEIFVNTTLRNILNNKYLLVNESVINFDHLLNSADNFIDSLEHFLDDLHDNNGNSFANLVEIVSDIWRIVWIPLRNNAEHFLASIEHNADLSFKYNFTALIKLKISHLIERIQKTIDDLSSYIMSLYRKPVGFGLRYKGTLNIFSLTISDLEIEFDYSINYPRSCGHFLKEYELLKDERVVRLYGILSTGNIEVAPFIHMDAGFGVALALSVDTPGKMMAQLRAKTNVLGITTTSDIYFTSTGHYFVLMGRIWNTFMAELKISFQSGRKRIETYDVLGKFVTNVGDDTFHDSYHNELLKITQKIADDTETRLRVGQRAIDIAQEDFLKVNKFLEDKKIAFQVATSAYNETVQSLEQTKSNLENAEVQFINALSSLGEAQKNVNSLCKIQTCRICVPGRRCRRCWFIFFFFFKIYYPCCSYIPCFYTAINPRCVAYNAGCRAVRALAYFTLERGKTLYRVHYLAFEDAKRRVSNAQIIVDQANLALDIANDAFDLAQMKFDAAGSILESAKQNLEKTRVAVKWGIKALNFIITYGTNSLIDVKNCEFGLKASSQDTTIFPVECELNFFREGYRKVRLGVNFGSPLQSIWQAAKGTIDTLVDASRRPPGRGKREINHEEMYTLHDVIRKVRNVDTDQNDFDTYENDTIDTLLYTYGFKGNVSVGDYENRVEVFQGKCSVLNNVMTFFSEAVQVLIEMSNETANSVNKTLSDEGSLEDFDIDVISSNFSIESIGINTDEARSTFNMSEDDINIALQEAKENLTHDQVLSGVQNFTEEAKSVLNNQTEDTDNITIINHWILAMENAISDYFSNESCVSFIDCSHFAFFQLYDLFEEEKVPNMSKSLDAISTLNDSFLGLLDNTFYTILEVYSRALGMQEIIDEIKGYDVFCSEPPKMLSQIGSYNVTEGSTLQMFCNATGNPKPQIWWYRNDEPLSDQNDQLLVIYGVTKADENKYRCIAGNLIANLSSEYAEVYVSDYKIDINTSTDVSKPDDLMQDKTDESAEEESLAMVLGTTFGILLAIVLAVTGFAVRLHVRKRSRKDSGRGSVADINMVRPTESKPRFEGYLVARDKSLDNF